MDSDYHFLKYLSLVRAHKIDDIDAEMFPSKQSTVFLAVLLKDIWYKTIFSQNPIFSWVNARVFEMATDIFRFETLYDIAIISIYLFTKLDRLLGKGK